MKAEDVPLTQLLEGPKQFIVPVFQRDYSWGTKHCLQLWNDIVRVGVDSRVKAHFIGSVVYIAAEDTRANISRWLLVDGQQRITTVTLLLTALRNRLPKSTSEATASLSESVIPPRAALNDYYLCNTNGVADRRHKLQLRRADQETMAALLDEKELPSNISERIAENYDFFRERLENSDVEAVYRGIQKLVTVDVCLARGQDDPQMIFESLNSTGLDLTQADLIRNYVLMRQEEQLQTQLFNDYWRPIETAFGAKYRSEFDKFVRDYLTLKLMPSKQLKADVIYQQFRTYFTRIINEGGSVEAILADLRRFGRYYVAFNLGLEENPSLKAVFLRLKDLVGVASTVILRLYDCFDRARSLTLQGFVEAIELLESYVFRQSMCAMQPRSLGQVFASLAYRIKDDAPLNCLKVSLSRQGRKRRFPSDLEFKEALETRDIYDSRHCFYLLDRLENAGKERIDTSKFTIEHIMPQNDDLPIEWRQMLGENWESSHGIWLHKLGNLTLTGYNSEYSDRSFAEKKSIKDGFDDSPLRLNKTVKAAQSWTETEMEHRGKELAGQAVRLWAGLVVDSGSIRRAELEEHQSQAAQFSIENLEFDPASRELFDALRSQIISLGHDVVELCSPNSVVYRVYDFFVEIIPRKRRLSLLLNLDFEDCNDPSRKAADASEFSFIIHASQSGGVLFSLGEQEDLPHAIHLIRQAFEAMSD